MNADKVRLGSNEPRTCSSPSSTCCLRITYFQNKMKPKSQTLFSSPSSKLFIWYVVLVTSRKLFYSLSAYIRTPSAASSFNLLLYIFTFILSGRNLCRQIMFLFSKFKDVFTFEIVWIHINTVFN